MKLQKLVLPLYFLPVLVLGFKSDNQVFLKNLSELHIKLKDAYKIDSVRAFGKGDSSNYVYFTVDEKDKKEIIHSLKEQVDFEAFKRPDYENFLTTKNTGRVYQSTYIFKHFRINKAKDRTTAYTLSIDTITNKAELDAYYY